MGRTGDGSLSLRLSKLRTESPTTVVMKNHIGERTASRRLVPARSNAAHKTAAKHIKVSVLRTREMPFIFTSMITPKYLNSSAAEVSSRSFSAGHWRKNGITLTDHSGVWA